MKKISVLTIAFITIIQCTFSQNNQNGKIDDFMSYLSKNGAIVSVSRLNDKYHIAKRYNVVLEKDSILSPSERLEGNTRVPQLIDSICTFFDCMIRRSIESYRYESHKNNTDTITYSVATKGYGKQGDYLLDMTRYESPNFSWTNDYNDFHKSHSFLYNNSFMRQEETFFRLLRGNSRRMYFGAKEAGMFDYVNGKGNIIYISNYENKENGTYYNFDISPLDSTLELLLKNYPEMRKVQVTYKNDHPSTNDIKTTLYHTKLLDEQLGSQSEGTMYIIPPSSSSPLLYQQLFAEANKHLDTQLTQCCVLEYTDHQFLLTGVKSTQKLLVNHKPQSSLLVARIDTKGNVYILRIETDGECWVPRSWHKIKSSIQGKTTYIK